MAVKFSGKKSRQIVHNYWWPKKASTADFAVGGNYTQFLKFRWINRYRTAKTGNERNPTAGGLNHHSHTVSVVCISLRYKTHKCVRAWLHLCVNFRPLHLALIRAKKYSILRTEKNDFLVPGAGGREMTTVHGYVICNFGSWCWMCLLCLEGIVSRPSKTKDCQSTAYVIKKVNTRSTLLFKWRQPYNV